MKKNQRKKLAAAAVLDEETLELEAFSGHSSVQIAVRLDGFFLPLGQGYEWRGWTLFS